MSTVSIIEDYFTKRIKNLPESDIVTVREKIPTLDEWNILKTLYDKNYNINQLETVRIMRAGFYFGNPINMNGIRF